MTIETIMTNNQILKTNNFIINLKDVSDTNHKRRRFITTMNDIVYLDAEPGLQHLL